MTTTEPTPNAARTALAQVQRSNADRIESEQENALLSLKSLVRAATREIEALEQGMTSGTDFVSQYAEKYALSLAKLEAYGSAARSLAWLAEQGPSA